ncbi:hypothetical protein [Nocardioides convexus]|uniref:hypothetical protein n=1 Tax=Nocardioides convexus TaxID=2712224 RepID=UPI0024189ED3|nr:hypothetical protein [Nocardioides convexus]
MGFVRRQAITAALTANAIRPIPGFRPGIPAFFAGWLTGEPGPARARSHRRRRARAQPRRAPGLARPGARRAQARPGSPT